jgi:hypothetical protein
MRLDGSEPMLWVTTDVSDPHGIVVDAVNERVIWSNQEKSPKMRQYTNISSVSFLGDDQRIDFVPHSRFEMVGFVQHLAIVEVPVPEPATYLLACAGAMGLAYTRIRERSRR